MLLHDVTIIPPDLATIVQHVFDPIEDNVIELVGPDVECSHTFFPPPISKTSLTIALQFGCPLYERPSVF